MNEELEKPCAWCGNGDPKCKWFFRLVVGLDVQESCPKCGREFRAEEEKTANRDETES